MESAKNRLPEGYTAMEISHRVLTPREQELARQGYVLVTDAEYLQTQKALQKIRYEGFDYEIVETGMDHGDDSQCTRLWILPH